jgi:hypothetical protein
MQLILRLTDGAVPLNAYRGRRYSLHANDDDASRAELRQLSFVHCQRRRFHVNLAQE